jgi:Winged helix-turn helix
VSQKELQRVAVIAACLKGEVACVRAAELLCLSVRQIKRLRKRMREDGEAALAHASRGRPSPRRLPARMQDRILHLPAPAMLVLTIIISARRLARVFRSAGRRSALCSARTVSAPPRNDALLRTASDVFAALVRAKCSC